ncbi:MAG: iron-sulfur cluster assembly accessory protein [Candidatus Tectomicrobia bacterium]|uniref:Iron-sulfur cluster assembly accessory protein n=1 Tax=Tectimicrobiota bacterium TaxID=2528274 RepID=A0A932HZ42_UNCTE|nr:iron-sulfur cluster assembly accessory protein [Candidatus Tectomicrobia bacterium]
MTDAAAARKPASLEVTDGAFAHMKRLMEKDGKAGSIVRVGVKGGGCSGLSYVLQFEPAEKLNPMTDTVVERDGVRLAVDRKSALFLAGTVLDYEEGLMGKGFTFKNPNARQTCGCGSSFSA